MRFSWLSNAPWTTTGYGNQTRYFTKRILNAGHPIAVIANYGHQGAPLEVGGVKVYGNAFHPFCADVADAHNQNFGADVMISLMDIWVMAGQKINSRWAMWIPVDHNPIPPPVAEVAKTAYHRIAMSKFAVDKITEAGMDCDYVPCGVETDVYKPTPLENIERKAMHLDTDKFIVGMVAANKGDPPRKAFWANIDAFCELHQKHPDTLLYLHTATGSPRFGEQVDILGYCLYKGLVPLKDFVFPDQYNYLLGYTDVMMAKLYSAMDVHLLVSMGEGFGIPIIEAQACGTPVIVGDWTSMGELCFSGWKVDVKNTIPYWGALQAYMYHPNSHAIAERLFQAYERKGNQDYRKAARKGALAYDCDKIFEKYWKTVIKHLEEKVASEGKTVVKINGVVQ
jgi:glycosyltransferase involved in cell wall biosynthesis